MSKVVKSSERSTGMGANSFSAIAINGEWVKVSQVQGRLYEGRENGWENYSVEVDDATPHAEFYRSNRGNESVAIYDGDKITEVRSFELADKWLSSKK